MLLAEDDAYRRHPNKSSPDDRFATSPDTGRDQIPSEQVVPLASFCAKE
jgi:hypothetical protein